MNFEQIKELDTNYVVGMYARFPLAIKSGKGVICEDFEGKQYIDFSSGIGVNCLGFADPDWAKAVYDQMMTISHISNLYYTQPGIFVAKALCERTGMSKVSFANSGAEANEAAIKVARKYSYDKYGAGRFEIVTLENSFHGRTITTLAATGQVVMHASHFAPYPDGFVYSLANDVADLKSKVSNNTCAIMIELIQGEGGVIPLDASFVSAVVELCAQKDLLLIIDEVQSGVGRTGALFCFQSFGLSPDIVTCAKGLGGGLPIGAVLYSEKAANVLQPGDHATTFGMNAAVCAGANVVLEKLNDQTLSSVSAKGEKIIKALSKCGNVESVTGMGLMLGILPRKGTSRDIVNRCIEKGLIVLTDRKSVV